ncbi:MAG: hypothetical protein A2Y00_01870 [Omnitrophica WOR_2 bacterium GWF2_43_52]|nr:MAG: hypothetical protein A2Y00_01870 [Omnitrophica WOR_2 bacterium GWF2_43_52]HAH21353.1 hypothetical protein [Candidatus Omnitrophota bacterium]HBG63972.1 hypothetical protein [Candidatus Omnitrophota bacterium]
MIRNFTKKIAFLSLAIMLTSGCVTMGKDALTVMKPEEKNYLETTLSKIYLGMTEEEVIDILGPKYYRQPFMMMWYPEVSNGKGQIRVYFWKSKVSEVKWIKIGSGGFAISLFNDIIPDK